EDDRNTLATSPTSSWDSSRRSSFSSTCSTSYTFSTSHNLRIKHCKSLPPSDGDKHALYPTREAAFKRIELLEEQMRLLKQSNETTVKNMSQSIQKFMNNRKEINCYDLKPASFVDNTFNSNSNSSSCSGSSMLYTTSNTDNKKSIEKDQGSSQHHANKLVLDKLMELKQIVDKYNVSLALNQVQDDHNGNSNNIQSEIYFSTQTIDKWIAGVTGYKQSTKQDFKNVLVPLLVATEKEKQRNTRLIEGLNRLSSQKKAAQLDAIQQTKSRIVSLQTSFEKQKKKLRQRFQHMLDENKEEQIEIEQVVDDMRREMEIMMEELNQSKEQKERFEQKSKRFQDDLKALQELSSSSNTKDSDFLALQSLLRESETQITYLEAYNQEQSEKLEQIKQDFAKEKSRIHSTHTHQVDALVLEKEELRARLIKAEKSVSVASRKVEIDTEMEQALRRTVAERDGELAKAKFELEKTQRHSEQLQKLNERQMQLEIDTRLNDLETSLKSQYRKDFDTYQVRITREIRNMSGQLVELETELQDLERQHLQDVKLIKHNEQQLSRLEKECILKSTRWQDEENELKSMLKDSDQKITTLEKEALILYGKNLELAQHLGELDS
ncbi:hypothetical protein INT46_007502, partial [Mucor plumbeus]